jgi:putative ABC transport system permease protein
MRTGGGTPPVLREIVGVVENATDVGLDPGEPMPALFAPFAQDPWSQHTYLVRTTDDPASLAPVLRDAVLEADPNQPLFDVEPFAESRRVSIGRERLSALVLTGFAVAALLLAALGIYGVVAYSVTLRTKEIGVRLALGADNASLTGLLFAEGLVPVVVGVAAGAGLAAASVQVLRGLLYQVSPADPWALAGAGLLLTMIAGVSIYLPARRTMRVDPIKALRPD